MSEGDDYERNNIADEQQDDQDEHDHVEFVLHRLQTCRSLSRRASTADAVRVARVAGRGDILRRQPETAVSFVAQLRLLFRRRVDARDRRRPSTAGAAGATGARRLSHRRAAGGRHVMMLRGGVT